MRSLPRIGVQSITLLIFSTGRANGTDGRET
jgi:hypothetical protein